MFDWNKLRKNYSLEDFINALERNKPHGNSKLYKEWVSLVNKAYKKLSFKNENYNEYEKIINDTIDFLVKQKKICMKGMIYYE